MAIDRRLLVLDDEPDICRLINDVATDAGFACAEATDVGAFWRAYGDAAPELLILDLALKEGDGINVLRALSEKRTTASIVLISGYDDRVLATAQRIAESIGLNVLGTLTKPIEIRRLRGLLDGAGEDDSGAVSEDNLMAALENGELELYYQPRVANDGKGGWAVVGAEALIRWQRPARGLVLPGDFIPVAERTGAIKEITLFTFRSAVRQVVEWRRRGFELGASINLSPSLLGSVDLPDVFASICAEHDTPPQCLTLEVTESGIMDDPTVSMEILSRARLKGFDLAIDDFGTGYSSLVQLYRMPFNELKIDREFVKDLPHRKEAREIASILIELGRRLGLKVCAEGVETPEALDALGELGCDIAQGFHIAKPLPVAQLDDFLEDKIGPGTAPRAARS